MFTIHDEVKDKEYKVKFYYSSSADEKPCIWTDCVIEDSTGDTKVLGTARCSDKDMFSKNEGRKLSLVRALQKLTDDKETRQKFWDTYFSIRGKY
jgi:hypothetical protein